jgi:Tol biopolymer transport system component/predicted Ser/Thr protein kinase
MTLSSGGTLGPYEIIAKVGEGGMGEVYRARDTRLDRDVAIKVSTTEFSERFSREARSIGALNHANVCHLYDVGPNYLVLEYVEGENLRGPVSFDEALPIVRQLIDGIEAAHEKNIIHRDLKTANIRITPEGVVKILDFGLAKAAEPQSSGDSANSPTFTMGMTQAGVILGTAAYMSPEQAKGRSADKRSDIWSFGVVVYELLTGRTPFEADNTVEILGAVINKEPDWSRVPPHAQRLLRWCLEKDRRKRLAAIGDARMLLEESGTAVEPAVKVGKGRSVLWPAAAALLLLLAAASGYGWWSAARPVDRPLTRLSVDLGPEAVRAPRITAVLSPDGTRIVFVGRGPNGTRQLFTRRLDQSAATPLAGTEASNLSTPFFSPDGEWIGFFTGNTVRKVAAQGGSAVAVSEAPLNVVGADWGEDANIVVGSLSGLLRMPSAGGAAVLLKANAGYQLFPDVLPDARAVLFNAAPAAPVSLDDLSIAVLVFETGETKMLLNRGYWPRYMATSGKTGHIAYIHDGTLFGVAFDPERLEILGAPTPLLEDVATMARSFADGGGQFAFSDTGTFVYLSGTAENPVYPILWLDAAGRTTPLVVQPGTYGAPRLSPDGSRLAYTLQGTKGADVWVYDMGRDTPTQLTFTGPGLRELAWAPDSKHLVYGDGKGLFWIRADGSSQPQQLLESAANPRPFSFSPEGRLVYVLVPPQGLPDIWTLPIDLSDPEHPKPGKAEPFLSDPQLVEVDPAFSPDGKFLAYASSEPGSGLNEVFVRPFPGPGGKWKISTAGGKYPTWSRTTRELFFLGGDDHIMVVGYTTDGNSFRQDGVPRPWSPTQILRDGLRQNFDVAADGKRVVIFPRPVQQVGSLHATFLLNFFDEVRRRIP